MKIAVCLLTRENPAGLITALTAADQLSSGNHEIEYFVRWEMDDHTVVNAIPFLPHALTSQTHLIQTDRPITLGHAWNDIWSAAIKSDPDALVGFCDDVFPTFNVWDMGVAEMIEQRGVDVFAWRELANPSNITYPVFSKKWYTAALKSEGRIYTEYFPFWFTDTWCAQVYQFALGQPMNIVADMTLGGRRATTMNMRDVKFWFDFWMATQELRIEEGLRMRAAMGWPDADIRPMAEELLRLDLRMNPETVEKSRRVDFGPPSDRYLTAKAIAEQWLAQNGRAEHAA